MRRLLGSHILVRDDRLLREVWWEIGGSRTFDKVLGVSGKDCGSPALHVICGSRKRGITLLVEAMLKEEWMDGEDEWKPEFKSGRAPKA